MTATHPKPSRLLVVLPSWIGDTVMATPALRALRRALPGALIGGLMRPGLESLLAGTAFLDQVHVDRPAGMMGPKRVAARLRALRYDAALLFTNSFSTALITRLAGIPRRIGYDRDGRGLLLTDRLPAKRRRDVEPFRRSRTAPNSWAPVPACEYYFDLAKWFLDSLGLEAGAMGPMELHIAAEERAAASALLARRTGHAAPTPLVVLNPGGNNPAKRWPADRFARLAEWLVREHAATVLVSGSPAEADLTARIVSMVSDDFRARVIDLPAHLTAPLKPQSSSPKPIPSSLSTLKALIARCSLMVTNDTGPRHIAAALGVPVVSLFGPTDHRWSTIPFEHERRVLADPTLPEEEVADDHPVRCAIDRIAVERVIEAVSSLVSSRRALTPC